MGSYKTYFLFDSDTGFILSGFDHCVDNHNDGYNVFTRPYEYPEYHSGEKCRMETLYNDAIRRDGLKSLKYEDLRVAVIDGFGSELKQEFVKNPNYFYNRYARQGWFRLQQKVETL